MNRSIATFAVLASLVLSTAGAGTVLAEEHDPTDNGIVYMVHGHFEPAVTEEIPPPPAHEAFATTQQDGQIVLYVIPYSVETEAPVDSGSDVEVELEGQAADQALVVEPREGTSDDQRCVDETSIEGHEGSVSHCLVVEIPAEDVRGWTAVDITLRGTVGGDHIIEPYSSPAHVAMHTTMADGQPGWEIADEISGVATPFVVEDLVDPVP